MQGGLAVVGEGRGSLGWQQGMNGLQERQPEVPEASKT